jgi:hypothetical protein
LGWCRCRTSKLQWHGLCSTPSWRLEKVRCSMSFVTIVAWAAGAYVAFWAVYLPVAYYFNRDAERDPDDDPTPPWLPELLEAEQRRLVHQPYRPSAKRMTEPSRANVGSD